MTRSRTALLSIACLLCSAAALLAQPVPATQPAPRPPVPGAPGPRALTVAILDFDAKDPGNPDLGRQISETLTAILSGEAGLSLVERSTLNRVIEEHALNLAAVDNNQAVQVGKLVGARILVVGRAFQLGQQQFIVAKVIGTETSKLKGVMVKDAKGKPIDELVMDLSAKTLGVLQKPADILPDADGPDPVVALKERLAGLRRPTVAVIVTEAAFGVRAAEDGAVPGTVRAHAPDPPVETEIKRLLLDCGFVVQDLDQNALAGWAPRDRNNVNSWPRGLANVDFVITGESFSEFKARIGQLVSSSGRAEVNIISRKDGKVVFSDKAVATGVDLAEHTAGKKALDAASRQMGVKVLEYFAKTLPKAEAAPAAERRSE